MTTFKGYVTPAQGVTVSRNKYGARKTTVFGITFDSQREANRYMQLRAMLDAGEISNLRMQVPYPCEVNGQLVCRYIADFVYERDGQTVVEDVKGMKTPVYRLKRKLVAALHAIVIAEV